MIANYGCQTDSFPGITAMDSPPSCRQKVRLSMESKARRPEPQSTAAVSDLFLFELAMKSFPRSDFVPRLKQVPQRGLIMMEREPF